MGVNRLRKLKFGKITSALFVPIIVGIAAFLLIRDSSKIPLESIHLNIPLVLLSFAIECAGLLIAIPVWRHILASIDVRSIMRDDVRIYCYSALGSVLPGGIWTIAGRTVMYQRLGHSRLAVITASLTETLMVGVAAMGVYIFSIILRPEINLLKSPEIGIAFSILVLLLINPKIFNPVNEWIQKRFNKGDPHQHIRYGFGTLATWLGLEIVVTCIGGLAIFVLLQSLLPVSFALLVPVMASWAAASAVGNLFFWLPGTSLLRDGAMVIALSTDLSLPIALAFVAIVRIWTLGSLLALAGLVRLFIDRPYQIRHGK